MISAVIGFLTMMSACSTTSESGARGADLIILRASYGIGANTVDVTAAIQSLVKNDMVHLLPKWDIGPIDPAYGLVKRVTIAYQYQGQLQVASFEQTEELILPESQSLHRPSSRI